MGAGHYHDLLRAISEPTKELREHIGPVYDGFGAMHRGAFADGALSPAMKELIATAIAITEECDGCIATHAGGAARKGAPDAEFAEMVGVAILMQGGPGTIYGPRAWEAFQEFKT